MKRTPKPKSQRKEQAATEPPKKTRFDGHKARILELVAFLEICGTPDDLARTRLAADRIKHGGSFDAMLADVEKIIGRKIRGLLPEPGHYHIHENRDTGERWKLDEHGKFTRLKKASPTMDERARGAKGALAPRRAKV